MSGTPEEHPFAAPAVSIVGTGPLSGRFDEGVLRAADRDIGRFTARAVGRREDAAGGPATLVVTLLDERDEVALEVVGRPVRPWKRTAAGDACTGQFELYDADGPLARFRPRLLSHLRRSLYRVELPGHRPGVLAEQRVTSSRHFMLFVDQRARSNVTVAYSSAAPTEISVEHADDLTAAWRVTVLAAATCLPFSGADGVSIGGSN